VIYSKKIVIDQFAPIAVYEKIKAYFENEVSFLFESAGATSEQNSGNYSIIAIGARERLTYKNNQTTYIDSDGNASVIEETPFNFLKSYYKDINQNEYRNITSELGLGYVDGFIGFIGYDMVKTFEPTLENIMSSLEDTLDTPDLDLILPKFVAVYSHKTHEVTILSALKSISDEFNIIKDTLLSDYQYTPLIPITSHDQGSYHFSKNEFFNLIVKSKEMIKSGDVFQILMTNRYTQKAHVDPFSFYRVLRTKNPSPYMFLMEYETFSIVGSSPEVMVRLQDKELLLRPIAGTRKRGKTKVRDLEMEHELVNDPKECAEHLMLIDLGRNDVSRVAKVGTVKVLDMMHVERYSHVMHMVSDVTATIEDSKDMFDLFAATFTAGTMTGAPKIRAMELIAEFEQLKRGFYSGSIAYFGFDGNMDSAITIRTAMVHDDKITLQAGAGVVADSINELEYLEVKNKLGALLSSINALEELNTKSTSS
jgi:anthranilate synthase component 1